MRSQKKQQIKQKIFQSWTSQACQGSTSIHWKANNLKIKPNEHANNQSCTQVNSSIKNMVNKLIAQNSELRKQIYKLQHETAVIKVAMESKQLQYKNVIREYRQMIDSMIESMGYEGIESIGDMSNAGDSWVQRRSKLYEKFDEEASIQYRCNLEASLKTKFNRSYSFSVGDNESFVKQTLEAANPEQRLSNQGIVYFEYKQQKTQRQQQFGLNPCDYLNFDERKATEGANHDFHQEQGELRLNTLSSVTDAYKPNLPAYKDNIESEIIPTVKLDLFKITACTSKAQTERMDKNTQRKQKKSSGRVSSQAGISSSSFQAMIQKGLKNRQRINQILQNNSKLRQIYQ